MAQRKKKEEEIQGDRALTLENVIERLSKLTRDFKSDPGRFREEVKILVKEGKNEIKQKKSQARFVSHPHLLSSQMLKLWVCYNQFECRGTPWI